MAVTRITQRMMTDRSLGGMQAGLNRLSRLHEQLSTGRVLNRPSDSPTDTSAAMRMRDSLSAVQQYQRNAQDGLAWLDQVDSALASTNTQLGRVHDLGQQGVSGAIGAASREALATEVDQIRAGILSDANTAYLGQPVFGGITAGSAAYDASGTWIGQAGTVNRTVGEGTRVQVDVDGQAAFGPNGNSVFDHLTALSAALRAGDIAGVQASLTDVSADLDRVTTVRAQAGSTTNRIEAALSTGADNELKLKSSLSDIENVDLAEATVNLQLQEVAYQAALGATSRVMQPSLMDFLR